MGTMTMELGGKVVINCEKTGYSCEMEFKLRPFLGGGELTNAVSGRIKIGKETIATLGTSENTDLRRLMMASPIITEYIAAASCDLYLWDRIFTVLVKTDTGMTPWLSRIRRLVTRNCFGRWDALEIKLSAAYSLSRDSFKVLFYNFKLIWPGQRYFWSSSSEGKVSKNCIRTKLHHCIASDAFQRSLPRNHRWKIWEREALYKTAKIYI